MGVHIQTERYKAQCQFEKAVYQARDAEQIKQQPKKNPPHFRHMQNIVDKAKRGEKL